MVFYYERFHIFRTVKNSDSLGNHLNSLLHDAENRIHELGSGAEDISQPPFSTRASFSSIIGE